MSEQQRRAIPSGLGALLAVLVIVAALVLWLMGRISGDEAALVGTLGLARLLP